MSSLWDYIGNVQKSIGNNVETNAVPAKNGRIPFGVTLDVAKSLPKKDSYSDARARYAARASLKITNKDVEKVRATTMNALGTGMRFVAQPIVALDKRTNGNLGKILTAGQQSVRSNYAFVRAVGDENVASGLLSGLLMIGGGVIGAIGGAAVGAALGAGVGAIPGALAGFNAGMALTGNAERAAAKAGAFNFVDKKIKADAKYAESAVGQEHYNFGREIVQETARVTGFKSLGDTSMGIGAVASGLLNFSTEIAFDPFLRGTSVAGKGIKGALVGGVVPKSQGLVVDTLNRVTGIGAKERAVALAKDIDMLKETGLGKQTAYTPLFDFIKKNDAATIYNHPNFKNNDMGQVAAGILSGKTDDEISLVLRIGRGDADAIVELESKYADTFSELNRYQSAASALEEDGMMWFKHDNSIFMVGKKYRDAEQLIKDEVEALSTKMDFVAKSKSLEAFDQTDRTVSNMAWVERMRADAAVRNTAIKLSAGAKNNPLLEGVEQQTFVGKTITSFYQKSGLSVPIHRIDRWLDDTPHMTIDFNEGIQSATRMRSNLRLGAAKGIINPIQGSEIFNRFISAKSEIEKLNIVEDYTTTAIRNAAIKYGHHESLAEAAVEKYLKEHKISRQAALDAKNEGRAYMVTKDGAAVHDPILITQLANGAYLPDINIIDKAFKEFGKDRGKLAKNARLTAYGSKVALDELNSIWRGLTLLRGGFTQNILRDATFRGWADASMFSSFKNLTMTTIDSITNGGNTVEKVKGFVKGATDPKQNLKNIKSQISQHDSYIKEMQRALDDMKYNPAKPPKEISPALARAIEQHDKLKKTVAELRRQEKAIVDKIPSKTIQRDKVDVAGWQFPASASGRLAEVTRAQLTGGEGYRGAIASMRELEVESVRRGSSGGRVLHAVDDEDAHLAAWATMLNNHLRFDPLAVKIMEGKMDKYELMNWLREKEQYSYIDRFGLTAVAKGEKARKLTALDAEYIYNRVNDAVESIASSNEVRKLVLADKLTAVELKKLYPKIEERPPVAGDVITGAIGTSNIARRVTDGIKDGVAWLATQPTARLNYNHYFAAKYYEKLETLVLNANERGILPDAARRLQYEKIARSYAINEFRNKINSFAKDMNAAGLFNYLIAFFPAVVEQFRAYGRIAMDNPEFPLRVAYSAQIPEYIGEPKTDSYGNKYLEVSLPFFGAKARFGVDWFNPINPTSGSLLSAGPAATTVANWSTSKWNFAETAYGKFLLPFGASSNIASSYTPNTVKKGWELFRGWQTRNTEQYQKDSNMLMMQRRVEFSEKHGGRQPSNAEMMELQDGVERGALFLSFLRFTNALTMPSQPRMATAVTFYQDQFGIELKKDPENGAAVFASKYPEYFMVADKLTNNLSGINSDETSVALLKKNKNVVKLLTGEIENLTALGTIFNDENFAFSSSAEAYLRTTSIPGLEKKFKENEAALQSARSSIVNKGWSDWFKLIEVASTEMRKPPYNLDPARGYGAVVLQKYKDAFIAQQKTENNMWYQQKMKPSSGGQNKQVDVIKAISIAANTPEMWKDLAQQARWHTIVEYMNFRYSVYDELVRRDTGYGTQAAADLRAAVDAKVWELRRKDIKFGQFYDRYFDGDEFNFVYDYTPPKRSK